MITVRIYPLRSAETVAIFLGKHGFNLSPLMKEGFFQCSLNEPGKGAIDTLEALQKIANCPKVDTSFEFRLEET